MFNLTKEQAIQMAQSGWWLGMEPRSIAMFQLHEPMLCMPFHDFHVAVEQALGRPVMTHEFAWADLLREELRGERPAPTMQEILDLIPEEKRILLVLDPEGE